MALNDILRRSSLVDTSGSVTPPAIQLSARMAGGVYPQDTAASGNEDAVLSGRISLTILGLMIVGAVGFYVWTRGIQGGG